VTGLQEVQRIAGPDDLAGLTAVYYSLSYLGFFVPAVLASLSPMIGYPAAFGAGACSPSSTAGDVGAPPLLRSTALRRKNAPPR
jgi:hypothetical protein